MNNATWIYCIVNIKTGTPLSSHKSMKTAKASVKRHMELNSRDSLEIHSILLHP